MKCNENSMCTELIYKKVHSSKLSVPSMVEYAVHTRECYTMKKYKLQLPKSANKCHKRNIEWRIQTLPTSPRRIQTTKSGAFYESICMNFKNGQKQAGLKEFRQVVTFEGLMTERGPIGGASVVLGMLCLLTQMVATQVCLVCKISCIYMHTHPCDLCSFLHIVLLL